jgi:hypothetical protein
MEGNHEASAKISGNLFTYSTTRSWKTDPNHTRTVGERSIIQLQHVRKLSAARNRFYLPNAMSQGITQWSLWQRIRRGLLR